MNVGGWIIGGISLAVVIIIGFGVMHSPQARVSALTTREIALSCTTDMATVFHIHPVLEIMINGQKQEISANTGIKDRCMNAIHTHDTTGTLHVEAPEKRDFTLADFFAVWNQPFSRDTYRSRMTVNGQENTEYEKLVLKDKDQIVIYYEDVTPTP